MKTVETMIRASAAEPMARLVVSLPFEFKS
jgi:hypothetical protein